MPLSGSSAGFDLELSLPARWTLGQRSSNVAPHHPPQGRGERGGVREPLPRGHDEANDIAAHDVATHSVGAAFAFGWHHSLSDLTGFPKPVRSFLP